MLTNLVRNVILFQPMKRLIFTLLLMLSFGPIGYADGLSRDCAAWSGTQNVYFNGQTFVAALMSYRVTIEFPDQGDGLKISTNWGEDTWSEIENDPANNNLSNSWAKSGEIGWTNQNCYTDSDACLITAKHWSNVLAVAKRRGVNLSKVDRDVLACANERITLWAKTIRKEVLQKRVMDAEN